MKRVEKKFYEANPDIRQAQEREEGDISVVSRHSQNPYSGKGGDKVGDYVDFEEINEK
jgi:hypothetical protein